MNIITKLSTSSLLFLGFSLDDWEFRLVLQGLVQGIDQEKTVNVGVQLEIDPKLDETKVTDYFKRYLGQFNIEIYWGSTQQFINELHAEWQQYAGNMGLDEAGEAEADDVETDDDDDDDFW